MQKAKQRSEIAQQDKWRIEDIYATDEAWEADYNECIRRAKEKCAYQGRLAESALILYQALKESDEADLLVEHVYVYAFITRILPMLCIRKCQAGRRRLSRSCLKNMHF